MPEFADMIIDATHFTRSPSKEAITESLKQQAPRLDRQKYEGHSKEDEPGL